MEYNFNLDKILAFVMSELQSDTSNQITPQIINSNTAIIEEYIIGYIQEWLYGELSEMNFNELLQYITTLLKDKLQK